MSHEALSRTRVRRLRETEPGELLRLVFGLNQVACELSAAGARHRGDGEASREGMPADPAAMVSDFLDTVEAFRVAGLRFALAGRLAVSLHGEPRTCPTIELVADRAHGPGRIRAVLEDLSEDAAEVERKEDRDRLRASLPSRFVLDVALTDPGGRDGFDPDRRIELEVEGQAMPVIALEDLILRRLHGSRTRARRNYSQALGVAQVQGDDLDLDYLREHCASHRVCNLVEEIAEEIGRAEG